MAKLIKTKRGLDIQLNGGAPEHIGNGLSSDVYTLVPDHYQGVVPKMLVKAGDLVKAGTAVFYDKSNAEIQFVAPVSGKVLEVKRGDRRKILEITIEPDKTTLYEKFEVASLDKLSKEEIKALLLKSGLWTFIKQRPYDVIANPNQSPKAIHISTFDTAPLAPNYEFIIGTQMEDFQLGINALAKLADGKVNLGVNAKSTSSVFRSVKNVEITEFEGKHPIGNVGIQIHHTHPINKGEVVWTINVQDVLFIGRLFSKSIVDLSRLVALTGPEVINTGYFPTKVGATLQSVIKNNISAKTDIRIISGNVLTGMKVDAAGVLSPYSSQITVIEEGSHTHELFGWAMPRLDKFSASNLYSAKLKENKLIQKIFGKPSYHYDARLMGGVRAIIMSGEYDKVLPMDILPEYLIKAMLSNNIDKMEALGAYEIAPEDVALCEFVCTSKLPLQAIVRNALDTMKKELE